MMMMVVTMKKNDAAGCCSCRLDVAGSLRNGGGHGEQCARFRRVSKRRRGGRWRLEPRVRCDHRHHHHRVFAAVVVASPSQVFLAEDGSVGESEMRGDVGNEGDDDDDVAVLPPFPAGTAPLRSTPYSVLAVCCAASDAALVGFSSVDPARHVPNELTRGLPCDANGESTLFDRITSPFSAHTHRDPNPPNIPQSRSSSTLPSTKNVSITLLPLTSTSPLLVSTNLSSRALSRSAALVH